MPRSGIHVLAGVLLAALSVTYAPGQSKQNQKVSSASSASAHPEAVVTGARVVQEHGTYALEVVSTQPVVPVIQMLDSPPRLVVDIPNARMGMQRKRTPVQKENILTIRAEQYQIEPAITRIVVDLLVPYAYTWDAAGNRLMVRLKGPEDPNAAKNNTSQPEVASLTPAAAGAVVPVTNGVGDFVLTGKAFADGSSLTAGSDTAVLRLSRGGEVRVCPGTTVSVTPAKGSKNLMLGMSTGSLETHYTLKETADTVLTPDFRILFAGPGEFHYAVGVDAHGNTCVRGLKRNAASAIVYEGMGDRIYQVKPSEQLVFHSGRIDNVDGDVPADCGCPPPLPVIPTQAAPAPVADSVPAGNLILAESNSATPPPAGGAPQVLSNGPETRPLPPSQPGEVHIQIEAPLVFNAKKPGAAEPTPAPVAEVAALPLTQSSTQPVLLEAQVKPPPATAAERQEQPERHGVLHRIKGFFAALFH